MVIRTETLNILSVLIFACLYVCELKKSCFVCPYFCEWLVSLKFRVYKFQPQRKKNKKKTVKSSDTWLMFLSKSTEKQASHNGKIVVIDWF